MSYMHIDNLYKNQTILLFKECYAMEKIHGTSAHISWQDGKVTLSSGGASGPAFAALFDVEFLAEKFTEIFGSSLHVVVFGEAYGGKMQNMSATYGPDLRFIVFEVKVDDTWLNVLNANDVANKLGLEFVYYVKIPAMIETINFECNTKSVQAFRNGMGEGHNREGIVLRPLIEVTTSNGNRIISKHKNKEFAEVKTPRVVGEKVKILRKAEAIANEWVTARRLEHVLQQISECNSPKDTKLVIQTMVEDILREGRNEIEDTQSARKAIGKKTASMWIQHLDNCKRLQ